MLAIASLEFKMFLRERAPLHHPTPNAPNTWTALAKWGEENLLHQDSLPVYDGGCENSVYDTPYLNHCFRAWHDSLHLELDLDFSLKSELKIALAHRDEIRDLGLSTRDQDIVVADVAAQALYYDRFGVFVEDQQRFVADVLDCGLTKILSSCERLGLRY